MRDQYGFWAGTLTRALGCLLLVSGVSNGKLDAASHGNMLANAIDETALDRTTDPCQDFYQFACGNWIAHATIPAGHSSWTRSFDGIQEENLKTLKQLLEAYAAGKSAPKIAFAEKVGDYYAACMDEKSADKVMLDAFPAELLTISRIQTLEQLPAALAELHAKGVHAFFAFGSDQDYKEATQVIGELDRDGMGLPDKDYYLSTDASMVLLRKQYVQHIAKTLELSGVPVGISEKDAENILKLETELASHSLSLAERRAPSHVYHPMDEDSVRQLAPAFNWDRYFAATEVSLTSLAKKMNVTEPEFFKGLNTILKQTNPAEIRSYLRWQFLRATSSTLTEAFIDENFAFYGKLLSGKQKPAPRWNRCVDSVTSVLGEALGEAFVKLKFSEGSKAETRALIENIHQAVAKNFEQVEWMDSATRAQALKKLGLIFKKIGYPDRWRDYSAMQIDRASYFQNSLHASVFEKHRDLEKIGKPVDRGEWGMPPQQVNAYYNPSMNEIVFPAAILQPPFFDAKAPIASNYGGIGMVMGHETTHAFDDQGRHFDGFGNLSDWWTAGSAAAFEERAACLVKQFDAYPVADGVHLNGKLTLGENIADLGGLKLSYAAFQEAKKGKPAAAPVAGFNEDQQFFVSFAQGWCTKATVAHDKLQAKTNPHSTSRYRVNGVVVNVPPFAQVFGCKTDAPMAPVQHCTIW